MRSITPVQLFPRRHCSHVDGLLWEPHHLGAKLHQWVECYDRSGDHPVWFSQHVCRQVRPNCSLMCWHIALFFFFFSSYYLGSVSESGLWLHWTWTQGNQPSLVFVMPQYIFQECLVYHFSTLHNLYTWSYTSRASQVSPIVDSYLTENTLGYFFFTSHHLFPNVTLLNNNRDAECILLESER